MAIKCRDFERLFNELVDSDLPVTNPAAGGGDSTDGRRPVAISPDPEPVTTRAQARVAGSRG